MAFAKRQHTLTSLVLLMFCFSASVFSKPKSIFSTAPSTQEKQTPSTVTTAPAQTSSELPVPDKAIDILLAAAQVNGLDVAGLKPWHILVSYDVFDEDGDNVNDGTYEEFWVGPKQYRLIYTSKDFTQTDIATDQGLY